MRGLKDKRVLITGGASGIGAATALRFLEEGSVVCVLDRDADACKKIVQDLPQLAGTVIADVSELPQVESAFKEAIRLMGGVDVLINNAGISIRHAFLDITPEDWAKVIAVNLTGVFYVAQAAARHMWELGKGVILQTASTNGVMGYPYYADYNAVNRKIPLRRHAKPEEIAALFAFLASDDAAFMTGHVYTADGAETAGGLASR
jgi:meso-butanediol dehydrogenase/(S,S)-butanediol dehydrogenase/diacetyl reductase